MIQLAARIDAMRDADPPPRAAVVSGASASYGYPLALLTILYTFNFVDRQVVAIVAEPIKAEFGLADWQIGAMSGLSIALLYTLAGFPIARLAERGDRARIIAAAVAVWSLFTALCGFAGGFVQLFAARIGVGLGEAGCTPPAQSLIIDIVPRAKRASALTIYAMGAPLGQLIGLAFGGVVADLWGWRSVFWIAGAPGLVLAAITLATLVEPRRHAPPLHSAALPSFRATAAALLGNRSFVLVALGSAATGFVFYGQGAFYASFFLRNHGVHLAEAAAHWQLKPIGLLGLALGAASGLAGVAGAIVGGQVSDAWARRDAAAHVKMPAVCALMAMPLLVTAMLASDAWAAIGLIAVAAALNSAWLGSAFAAALGLVEPRSRATASALLLFIINVIGLGLGPLVVGLLSDGFAATAGPAEGIRWAMVCATTAGLISVALFWEARKSLPRQTVS